VGAFCFAPKSSAYCGRWPDRIYLVRLKAPQKSSQLAEAKTVEVHGEHRAFLDSKGKPAASFPLEIVESWIQVTP
jgi:hypothetical protein